MAVERSHRLAALGLMASCLLSSCSSEEPQHQPVDSGAAVLDVQLSPFDSGPADVLADAPQDHPEDVVDGVAPDGWPRDASEEDAVAGPCPADMALVAGSCVDRYEAPNLEGELPLVMYTFVQADDWCIWRGKRLCFDDEWTAACQGPAQTSYPYGDEHQPGWCNDDKTWRTYDQALLNGWPASANAPEVQSLEELMQRAEGVSATAASAVQHVMWLYQAEPGGSNLDCQGPDGVLDLCGNVEEWTRRRDGGTPSFSGALKGRYWAEPRTCQSSVTTHGDGFRFYEIGFRCCLDAAW